MNYNPNAPISQVEIEMEIARLVTLLEESTEDYATLIEDASKKEAKYKLEWAKAYLGATGSIKERESWADYQLGDESYAWKISDALVKAKKESLTSIRTSIDALRTLAANVRAQV